MNIKICSRCEKEVFGNDCYCKECRYLYGQQYYLKNKDQILTRQEPARRRSRLLHKYKISLEKYQTMWDIQKGLCAVCNAPETSFDKRTGKIRWLSVDHDHETGEIRGLLCHHCNAALGNAFDSIERLEQLIDYLKKYK